MDPQPTPAALITGVTGGIGLHSAIGIAKTGAQVWVSGGDKPAAVDPDNLQAEQAFKGLMTYTHAKSVPKAASMVLARDLEPDAFASKVSGDGARARWGHRAVLRHRFPRAAAAPHSP